MVSRFDDLRGGDVAYLMDVVRNVIETEVYVNFDDYSEDVSEILDNLKLSLENEVDDDKLKNLLIGKLTSLLKNDLNFWIRSTLDNLKSCFDSRTIARGFIDELGRFGWEVLPPESVRNVKSIVRRKYKFPRLKVLRRKNGTR